MTMLRMEDKKRYIDASIKGGSSALSHSLINKAAAALNFIEHNLTQYFPDDMQPHEQAICLLQAHTR